MKDTKKVLIVSVLLMLAITVNIGIAENTSVDTTGIVVVGEKNATSTPTLTPSITTTVTDKFRVGPTVSMRPLNDVISKDQDGLVELYMDNPSLNDVTLSVDVRISVPSGIRMYGEGFVQGFGNDGFVYTGLFAVPPGSVRTINIAFKSEKTGDSDFVFSAQFSGMYWPGGNKDAYQPLSLTHPFKVVSTTTPPPAPPVECNEYVASHPEIYPISSCQQIVSSWINNITNDGKTGITVDVGTTVKFSITTNSDIRSVNAVVEPNNIVYNSYFGPRTSFSDVVFDKIGHYNVNIRASNSFARGGVTWDVDVIPVVGLPPKIEPPKPVVMSENSRKELDRLNKAGKSYELILIRGNTFNPPGTIFANVNSIIFLYNEDPFTHYIKFSDNPNGYYDIPSGTIIGFCCVSTEHPVGSTVEYQDRDYPSLKGRITVTGVQVNPPAPGQIYAYDNIKVDHSIILCNVVSDAERVVTGGGFEKNCGNPDLNIDHYPLDLLPSGGSSGKISASEMVIVKIVTGGRVSLIPWNTQPVQMKWYDGSDNRLMFSITSNANFLSREVISYIGHFSWEINKPGKYYIDVIVDGFGDARVVFDVTGKPISPPRPVITISPHTPVTPVTTVSPQTIVTPVSPQIIVSPPAPAQNGGESPDPGCWDSYVGFGVCVGDRVTQIGVGVFVGIGKAIVNLFGL